VHIFFCAFLTNLLHIACCCGHSEKLWQIIASTLARSFSFLLFFAEAKNNRISKYGRTINPPMHRSTPESPADIRIEISAKNQVQTLQFPEIATRRRQLDLMAVCTKNARML